jgi:diguanylate cyclase (GGDEF)-like protein
MIKILVIDDNPNDRLIIRKIITSNPGDFEVIEAKDGATGIKLALEIVPDLVICDILMPEVDGYRVFTELSANKITQFIPFIFLTAEANNSAWRKAMNLGADDYLIKPVQPQDLLRAITARIQKFSLIKQHYVEQYQPREEELSKRINYDRLTNLPNRFSLREQFAQILDKWYKKSGQVIPILDLKLKQFDQIIYKYGYGFRDLLLKNIAERLVTLIGRDNVITHVDSDEFIIILAPVTDRQIITTIVDYIIAELSEFFSIDGQQIFIKVNIGIALYPTDGKNLEKLLRNSKVALNQIEPNDRIKYQFYRPTTNVKIQEEINLEKRLSRAIEKNELKVYYQAQINLSTGKITGGEALLRWHHPTLSFISPSKFLPLAEETGLIEPIGTWLLNKVCQQIRYLYSLGFKGLNISVNLSARQFNQIDFNRQLMQALIGNNLSANCLTLEIKEHLLLENNPIAIGRLNALHSIGIKISLDDFGTGYSSLSYLQSFPVDIIKIDQCLVKNIDCKQKNLAITEAIINLAHKLKLEVVAEGVETQGELACLKKINCDAMQGYLFSVPLPFNEFVKLVQKSSSLAIPSEN